MMQARQASRGAARRPFNLDAYMLYDRNTLSGIGIEPTMPPDTVRQVQAALNALPSSLARLSVDGVLGPKTTARVLEYQRSVGGLQATGFPDLATRLKLFAAPAAPSAVPAGAAADYYVKASPFSWLAQGVDFGFGWSLDPGADAQNALRASLQANGYNVRIVFTRGQSLEVTGSQNIDRAHATDIRDQITSFAKSAGFVWPASPGVQFNVQRSGSSWQAGTPGSTTTWGDQAPVAPRDLLQELPAIDLNKALGGSWSSILLIGLGLVVGLKLLSGR